MKKGSKIFIITEAVLAVLVCLVAITMLWERRGRNLDQISVIVADSDDTQWSAFKYGLRMAAEDNGLELFFVSTGEELTVEEQQRLIQTEIEKMKADCGTTILSIAHRLSTLRNCDEIIVMDQGRIVERGTYQELESTPGKSTTVRVLF